MGQIWMESDFSVNSSHIQVSTELTNMSHVLMALWGQKTCESELPPQLGLTWHSYRNLTRETQDRDGKDGEVHLGGGYD